MRLSNTIQRTVGAALLVVLLASPVHARPPRVDPHTPSDNCWIWAASSGDPTAPLDADELRGQLLDGNSPTVVDLAQYDDDGWSVAWWTEGADAPTVVRDPDGAIDDEDFAAAVDEIAVATPHIAMAHFRSRG